MHDPHLFLVTFAVVLGVAAVTTVLFQRLRQPVVFGYLLAGLIVGPHIPIPLMADRQVVAALAELGVTLLMFSLGLEFSLRKLGQVGSTAAFVAVLQSSVMVLLGYTASRLFGWTPLESLYAGAIIAISSTTIIIKAFRDQGVGGRVADIVFGILIFEDLIAILLLAILTPASTGRELSAGVLAATIGRLVLFLAGILVVGLLVVPRAIRGVVALGRSETTIVACVGLCFGGSLLAQTFGYSVALGAFLAGALVAESGESPRIEPLIEPVRDIFAAIFFVSVGMLIDPALVARHWVAVVVFTLLVVVGKVGAVSISTFLTGAGLRTSVQAGMSLAQIGEFSFIIAAVGISSGATGEFLYPVAVAVSAATTLMTPWLIRAGGPLSVQLDRRLPRTLQTFAALYGSWIENLRSGPARPAAQERARRALRWLLLDALILAAIVVAGAMESGVVRGFLEERLGLDPLPAHLLVLALTAMVAAPFCLGMFRTAGTLGEALAAQSFPDPETGRLDLAAAPRRAMVVTIRLAVVLLAGLLLAAIAQPFLPAPWGIALLAGAMVFFAVAFWRSANNLRGHAMAGAEVVVAALLRQTREPDHSPADRGDDLSRVLPGLGHPVPVRIEPDSPFAGQSLRDLDLRGRTGATVLAILRGEESVPVPDGHELLREGDILALTGTVEAVDAARAFLGGEPATDPPVPIK